jgi:hypothetical protein
MRTSARGAKPGARPSGGIGAETESRDHALSDKGNLQTTARNSTVAWKRPCRRLAGACGAPIFGGQHTAAPDAPPPAGLAALDIHGKGARCAAGTSCAGTVAGDTVNSASPRPISAAVVGLALDCAFSRVINETCIFNTASSSFFILLSWLSIRLNRVSIVCICFLIRVLLQMRTATTTTPPTANALYSSDIRRQSAPAAISLNRSYSMCSPPHDIMQIFRLVGSAPRRCPDAIRGRR